KRNRKKFCSISCSAKAQPRIRDVGDGFIDKNGYRMLKRNGRYTPEHRLVMETKIGRKLFEFENVHHINGQKLDNRLENLEIWNKKHPSGQRIPDKVAHAVETLSLYPAEANTAGAKLLLSLPSQSDLVIGALSAAA